MSETVTYAEAARELETILGELESDRLDVDQVVIKVERAAQLIEICRAKVDGAKMAVERLSSELRRGTNE